MRKIITLLILAIFILLPIIAYGESTQELSDFQQALEQEEDNGDDQLKLGEKYYYGKSVHKDKFKALNYYLQAAEKGNAKGQFWSGYMYEEGLGTSRNLMEAKRLYLQAIKQGHTEAKTRLYLMNDKGQREIAKNKRMENIKIWFFIALLCPLWGLVACFFISCSLKQIFSFIIMTFMGGFLGFFIAFATNGGAAGSSEMSALSWVCLLIYLAFYYPVLAKCLVGKKTASDNLSG